jgi:hypothetical protein
VNEKLLTRLFRPVYHFGCGGPYPEFVITIRNFAGKELCFHTEVQFGRSSIFNFPWKITLNDNEYNCYDYRLPKLISDHSPIEFAGKGYYDNKYLLLGLADYSYNLSKGGNPWSNPYFFVSIFNYPDSTYFSILSAYKRAYPTNAFIVEELHSMNKLLEIVKSP